MMFGQRQKTALACSLVACAVLTFLALGVAPLAAEEAPRKGGILKVAAPFNPSSLDPVTGGAGSDHMILYNIYDTLVDFEPATLAARPGLALSWSFPEPTVLIMKLRENVRFHDGEPFNAAAVKANIERAISEPRSSVKGDLQSVAAVDVIDEYTVAFRLHRPDTALPLILADRAGMMSSPKAFEGKGREYDRQPVGTGPFKFASWKDGDVVNLIRNENYWTPELPHLDGMAFRVITDLNTGLRSVIAGENHITYRLNPQQQIVAERMKADIVISNSPTIADYHILFNYSRPPFNDVRVRQAICYAVDRDAFIKTALLGLGTPAQTMLPPGYWAHDSGLDNYYTYDPEKAKQLLAEAGYPNGVDVKFYGNSDQASQQRHEIIIEQLRKVGIRASLTSSSNADIYQRVFIQQEGDMMMTLWTGRPDPSQPFLLVYGEKGFNNAGKVPPPAAMQEAQNESQSAADIEGRKAAFAKLERLALEHALSCEVAFVPGIEVYQRSVKGYVPNLLGKPKLYTIWLAE